MAAVELSPVGQPICAWTHGNRKFAIHVPAELLARLGMEVRVAFKRVPRRGLEIGGILLGHTDQREDTTTFWIEGFESIESEHRSGPSYILSEPDFVLLREGLTKHGAASIGIYRSQTRSQQLGLEETDSKLLQRCFDTGDVLFLIVCPVAGRAAFFTREGGELKCVYEFGLGAPLAPVVAVLDPPPERQTAPLPISAVSQSPPVTVDRRPPAMAMGRGAGFKFKKEMWLAAALVVSLVAGAGIGMLGHFRPPAVARPIATPPTANPQVLPANDLHLTVEGTGGLLRLHWDQKSSAVRDPSRAVLHIQDGDYQIVKNLAASELSAGSVTYEPRNRDVTFRLDVSSPTANASGLVQVTNMAVRPALPPVQQAEPFVPPPLQSAATVLSPSKVSPPRREAVPVVKEKEEIRPSPVQTSSGSDAVSGTKQDASLAADLSKEGQPPVDERAASPIAAPDPKVRVWPETVAGSSWGRLVGKLPLVRRLKKPAKTSAPAPIFQAQPVLTNPAKQSMTRPVSVDVRVDVGESGVVESAEVIEFSDPLNVALINSALAAAARWTFEPARSEDLAVASKVILHFRFTP